MIVFFFSSRRRHTRWPRDWSSDVCSSDLFPFNEWFSRIECSADLPSCKCPLVSGSIALHVFASPSAQQRWQRAHVLVLGGNGSHAGGAPAAHAVLSGRAERFGPSALVENDRSVQRAGGEPATEAVSLARGGAGG